MRKTTIVILVSIIQIHLLITLILVSIRNIPSFNSSNINKYFIRLKKSIFCIFVPQTKTPLDTYYVFTFISSIISRYSKHSKREHFVLTSTNIPFDKKRHISFIVPKPKHLYLSSKLQMKGFLLFTFINYIISKHSKHSKSKS